MTFPIKINPTNIKLLKTLGYKSRNYYGGPWGLMKKLTKLRDFLKKFGLKFPFNPAMFKHDLLYSKGGSFFWKMKVDFVFLCDMIFIIYFYKNLILIRKRLIMRALTFYIVVISATPI